jgi:hypothetical protein
MRLSSHAPERSETVDGLSDPEITNGMRAERAVENGHPDLRCGEDYSDWIADILHHAHSNGHDPMEILRKARRDFRMEAGALKDHE